MPFANKQLRISRHNIEQNYTNISFAPQNFENIDKITIYTKERDDKNNLRGILINDQRHNDFAITLTSEFGNLIVKNDEVFLKLRNGTLQRYNFESRQSEILKFDEYIFNLNNKNHESFNFNWKPNERFINELIYPHENLSAKDLEKINSEIHKRVNDPLIAFVFSIIICSSILGIKISRKGNFFNSVLTLIWCLIYIISLIFSYRLSEKSNSLVFLPYLINFTFFMLGLLPLIFNSIAKNDK
jgi:lipopolysaccharide export LptBFGC system permease protein LptF